MIGKIHIPVCHEMMDGHVVTEELIVYSKKKQASIVRETKTIACLLKSIIQPTP